MAERHSTKDLTPAEDFGYPLTPPDERRLRSSKPDNSRSYERMAQMSRQHTERLLPSVLAASCLHRDSGICCQDSTGSLTVVEEEHRALAMKRNETGLPTEPRASVTSLDEGHRDWASLPLSVVDELVRVLKSTRRWRLDGRSLRLLNRHWSAGVTMNVEEIRPDAARSIVDEDVTSLPMFQRAASVDISPFLTPPPKHALPRNRKKKKPYLENWYDARLEGIVDMLCQMPKLTQIEVGLKAVIIFHRHCTSAHEQLSRLGRITSVYFYDSENLKLYGKTHLNTTSMWPIYYVATAYSSTLAQMVGSLKRLESLEVEGSLLSECMPLDSLNEVKNVKLNSVDFRILTRLPNPLATTVSSVVMGSEDGFAHDKFVQLNRLVGLCLRVHSQNSLNRLCRSRVARDLKVLNLDASWWAEDELVIPNEACYTFDHLESLYMRSCHFDGASLRGRLPNLKALRVETCKLTDCDATFITQFGKLELLSWQNVSSPYLRYPE